MKLLPQDEFIRDNIKEDDILVVSIGGNDVALLPAPCTICAMAGMLQLPKSCVDNGFVCCTVPINDYCCGCTTSLLSCLGSWPPCLGYFRHLFGVRVQKYVEKLTSKAKPKKILICMIYYLDENANTQSWAGPALGAMGYNRDPSRLQGLIKKTFHEATRYEALFTSLFLLRMFVGWQKLTKFTQLFFIAKSTSKGVKSSLFLFFMH